MEADNMKKTVLDEMIDKIKNGESVVCRKCKTGRIVYEVPKGAKYPEIYCDNPKCKAKVIFN